MAHLINRPSVQENSSYRPRERVIIQWSLNDIFNHGREVILSSQLAVIIIF